MLVHCFLNVVLSVCRRLSHSRFELNPTNVVLSLGDCVVYENGSFQLGGAVEKAIKKHLQEADMAKHAPSGRTDLLFPPHFGNVHVGGSFLVQITHVLFFHWFLTLGQLLVCLGYGEHSETIYGSDLSVDYVR